MNAYGVAASPYDNRPAGDSRKKQSMAELKLRRLTELNVRLREDLERRRIPVSDAAAEYAIVSSFECGHLADITHHSLIAFTDREPRDYMVPSRWGTV